MCTLAWRGGKERWWVVFNRDERKDREEAEGVRMRELAGGGCVLSGWDPRGGGIWLGMNGHGLLVGLLNDHPEGWAGELEAATRSRGLLVWDLLGARDCGEAEGLLGRLVERDRYGPCHVLLWRRGWGRRFRQRSGAVDKAGGVPSFLSTSSYGGPAVEAARERQWWLHGGPVAVGAAEAGRILRTVHPEERASGLTMDREDARTVSQSIWEMDSEGVRVTYRRRQPGGEGYEAPEYREWKRGTG